MAEIDFLTLDDVLTLHADALEFAGGLDGVRSMDLLQGAIAQPQAGFGVSGRTRSLSGWPPRTHGT
jgi:prophage maintenance system killer protein